MEYTANNLEEAVTLFYRTEAQQQQAEAHQWLTEAQNSPQAWSFVWELLSPQRVILNKITSVNPYIKISCFRVQRFNFSLLPHCTQN